jgi:hypothetical protein
VSASVDDFVGGALGDGKLEAGGRDDVLAAMNEAAGG